MEISFNSCSYLIKKVLFVKYLLCRWGKWDKEVESFHYGYKTSQYESRFELRQPDSRTHVPVQDHLLRFICIKPLFSSVLC